MKKMSIFFILSIVAVQLQASCIIQSAQGSIYGWYENTHDTFTTNKAESINLDDMNLKKKISPSFSLTLGTGCKYPNLKLQYTNIKNSGTKTLDKNISFNQIDFLANNSVSTYNKSNIFDAIFFADIIKNHALLDFDAGLGLRYLSNDLSLKTSTKSSLSSFDKIVPTIYLKANLKPIFKSLGVMSELIYSPFKGSSLDWKNALLVDINEKLNAELGYRYNNIDIEDGYKADIEHKGFYLGFNYLFHKKPFKEKTLAKKIVELEKKVVDSDYDGINDNSDKCPNTPANSLVDKEGCIVKIEKKLQSVNEVEENIVEIIEPVEIVQDIQSVHKTEIYKEPKENLNIQFDTRSAVVKEKYFEELKQTAKYIKQANVKKVVIIGHTHHVSGSAKANKRLSLQRAVAVAKKLIQYGVLEDRIMAIGYGQEKPIASNKTKKGRAKNRRIDLIMVKDTSNNRYNP
jgi:outer membrane protein